MASLSESTSETIPFTLEAGYQPAGDQPQAIDKLVEGIQSGLSHQTLLGVTGSGKSVGYNENLLIAELALGKMHTRLVKAGPFIDGLMHSYGADCENKGETERYVTADRSFLTPAYDPQRGTTAWHPVAALLRHQAPAQMFSLTTCCGREIVITGDHNFWVLRNGVLTLIKSEEALPSDFLPTPDIVTSLRENLQSVDILPYLSETELSVFAEEPILEYLAATGTDAFSVGAKRKHCRLPVKLTLSDSVMSLLGYYIAEGNSQTRYFILSNYHPVIRAKIEASLGELGIQFHVRASSDYAIGSSALTALLAALCGKKAQSKRLPEFWPQLSDRSLGILLRAYFDGDGTVGYGGEVVATTASKDLASDLAYALKRFGIHARLRRNRKRATNSAHAGAMCHCVAISGQADLSLFSQFVGFDHPEKRERMDSFSKRRTDTNVDVVPIASMHLTSLRMGAGLSKKQLARLSGCSRPMISLLEQGTRKPSRRLLIKILDALAAAVRNVTVTDFSWWIQWRDLKSLCAIRWTGIKSVVPVKYDHPHVYDLSVPGPETFLSGHGDVFVHNTYSIANVIQRVQRPTMVLAHNKTLAAQLYGEFKEFFPHNAVEYFVSYYDYYQPEAYVPSSDTYIEKDSSINEHIEQMRLSATKALLERSDAIIVATVSAIYGLGDPQAYLSMVLHLSRGDRLDQRKLLRRLADMQYTRNDLDLTQGTYRVRGDVIDVFPAEAERYAVRIELFDDEIENLSFFDPLTGEIERKVPRLTIFPSSHYVTPKERLTGTLDTIREEMRSRLKDLRDNGKLLEAQRLEQRTMFDLEMMNEVGYCAGIENYSRYLSGRRSGEPPPCLFDYLPPNALLVIDESHQTVPQLGAMYKGDRSRKETLVEYGFRLPSALDNRPLRFDEWEKLAPQMIFVSATPGPYEKQRSGQIVEQLVRPTGLIDPDVEIRPVRTQVDDALSEINARVTKGERVLITTLTKRMAEDLTEYLHEHGVKVRYLHADIETVERTQIIRDLRLGKFDVLVGINLLREGLDLPEVSLVAIFDADKEGFLRSDGSLIQTIGRAARNINGKAILYADRITGSIQRALDETDRRRKVQVAFNKTHGITPRGIVKAVADIMEGARTDPSSKQGRAVRIAEAKDSYNRLSPDQIAKRIKSLEQDMLKHARNLEFEDAARLRDEIQQLRKLELGL